jgi:hypothetical protein
MILLFLAISGCLAQHDGYPTNANTFLSLSRDKNSFLSFQNQLDQSGAGYLSSFSMEMYMRLQPQSNGTFIGT